jgi:hypothetical protein
MVSAKKFCLHCEIGDTLVQRAIGWLKEAPFGVEFAEITLEADGLSATGVAIGSGPSSIVSTTRSKRVRPS